MLRFMQKIEKEIEQQPGIAGDAVK